MNRDQYSEGHYVILQYQLSEVFCKRRFSLKFALFTGKHLRWSLFLIRLQAFSPAPLLKDPPTQVFSLEYCGFLKSHILKNICERLILILYSHLKATNLLTDK